ncbi:hypothetical protein E2C01_038403 [Portunus trituberculatus]|uniref:Uncharacterized protein n=1 Tax=Portunus trituberculatus TaxID=210409 RepID=A0A5B7FGP3_PORTR|nr:hypothetical protein [Portunus trituberculatus]
MCSLRIWEARFTVARGAVAGLLPSGEAVARVCLLKINTQAMHRLPSGPNLSSFSSSSSPFLLQVLHSSSSSPTPTLTPPPLTHHHHHYHYQTLHHRRH